MNRTMCEVEVREVPENVKKYIVADVITDYVECTLYYVASFNTIGEAMNFISYNHKDYHNLLFTYGRA